MNLYGGNRTKKGYKPYPFFIGRLCHYAVVKKVPTGSQAFISFLDGDSPEKGTVRTYFFFPVHHLATLAGESVIFKCVLSGKLRARAGH